MQIIYDEKNKKAKLIVNTGSGNERRRRTKTISYTRKRDAERAWRRFADEVEANTDSDVTVSELVSAYIENRKILGAAPTTISGYKTCEKHLNSRFKRILARDLTTYQIDNYIVEIKNKYKSKTIRNIIALLNASYKRGIRTGLLSENPVESVSLPKKSQSEITTFSEEDVSTFLEALQNDRLDFKVAYELALLCGLRRSEILGLKSSDINTVFKTVRIHETRHVVYNNDDHKGKESIQGTKTKRSERVLALPDIIVDDVKALIELHNSYPFECDDYLILTEFGKKLHPAVLTNHLTVIEKNNDLPHVSLHALRHTFATLLNASGVDIAQISSELGHSNITTTLNVYMHVFGGTTSSSRGIANIINQKTATFSATQENEKTAGA